MKQSKIDGSWCDTYVLTHFGICNKNMYSQKKWYQRMPNVNPVKGLLQAGRSMIEKSKDYGFVELSHPWAFKIQGL